MRLRSEEGETENRIEPEVDFGGPEHAHVFAEVVVRVDGDRREVAYLVEVEDDFDRGRALCLVLPPDPVVPAQP